MLGGVLAGVGKGGALGVVEDDADHLPSAPRKSCEESVYADPNPEPAPNATAAHRVVGLLKSRSAAAAPEREPYTNLRSVRSMAASQFCTC